MMGDFAHLATRLFNTPLAILPGKAEIVMAALSERLGITSLVRANGTVLAFDDDCEDSPADRRRGRDADTGYDVLDGVAIIPVRGTLVQRLGTLRPVSGMTGYDGIRQSFLTALDDDRVEAIVFDVDSPGGEVAGCFDLADEIYGARGIKPMWSILGECAYSAAYAIASAADRLTVPRTGGTGSIGVIYMHVSFEDALAKAGIEVTLITKGALKADGSEYRNLSPDTFKRMKADISKVGALFDRTVARNRGITSRAVSDMEAGTFLGSEGVDARLADAVASPSAALQSLFARLNAAATRNTPARAARRK